MVGSEASRPSQERAPSVLLPGDAALWPLSAWGSGGADEQAPPLPRDPLPVVSPSAFPGERDCWSRRGGRRAPGPLQPPREPQGALSPSSLWAARPPIMRSRQAARVPGGLTGEGPGPALPARRVLEQQEWASWDSEVLRGAGVLFFSGWERPAGATACNQ